MGSQVQVCHGTRCKHQTTDAVSLAAEITVFFPDTSAKTLKPNTAWWFEENSVMGVNSGG